MVNVNGCLVAKEKATISIFNRGFNYGDAIFETVKMSNGKLLFWEDHYFRLMASMRIMRMEIPMRFTLEYLEAQITNTLQANNLSQSSARVKLIVNRVEGGLYSPDNNTIKRYRRLPLRFKESILCRKQELI